MLVFVIQTSHVPALPIEVKLMICMTFVKNEKGFRRMWTAQSCHPTNHFLFLTYLSLPLLGTIQKYSSGTFGLVASHNCIRRLNFFPPDGDCENIAEPGRKCVADRHSAYSF